MTKIESETVETGKNIDKLFDFLSDFTNFEKLLPADKVENFQGSPTECSFSIKGMPAIGMKIADTKKPELIHIVNHGGKIPFGFDLYVRLTPAGDNNCTVKMDFEADMNPMIRMMVEKPLGNFFNMLAKKTKDLPV